MENISVKIITWIAKILGIVAPILVGNYLVKRAVFNYPTVGFPIYLYSYELVEILIFWVLLILAWKWPIVGGISYLVVWPFFFIIIALENGMSPRGRGPSMLNTIPPLLAGVLFLVSGIWKRARRKKAESISRTPAD